MCSSVDALSWLCVRDRVRIIKCMYVDVRRYRQALLKQQI